MNLAQNFQEGNNLTHTWPSCIQPGVQRLALFLLSHREKLETAEWALCLQATAGTDAGEGTRAGMSIRSHAENGGVRPQA